MISLCYHYCIIYLLYIRVTYKVSPRRQMGWKGERLLMSGLMIPKRTAYALVTTIVTSPWASSWPRTYRQVFWLSDGARDVNRIASLLHKSEDVIRKVVEELTVTGYTSIQKEKVKIEMNVALLKQSFEMIAPQKEKFAHSFYQRLFTYYPATTALFAHTDMQRQESSLMATLAVVISGVERGENLVPILQNLGAKHGGRYGAMADHYPLVGGVLLETFHEYLGPAFTTQMQDAWSQAYELISAQMLEGARIESTK